MNIKEKITIYLKEIFNYDTFTAVEFAKSNTSKTIENDAIRYCNYL